jgi:hypothetical protein
MSMTAGFMTLDVFLDKFYDEECKVLYNKAQEYGITMEEYVR